MSLALRFDPAAILLHTTLVLAAGLLVASLLRRFGPEARVAALRASLLGLVAVLALSTVTIERTVAPAVQIAVPAEIRLPASAVRRLSPSAAPIAPSTFAPAADPAVPVDWRPWAIGLWIFGIALLMLRAFAGHLVLLRLRRRSRQANDRATAMLREIAGDSGAVLKVADVASPFIAGVFRPTLFLSSDAEAADDETLRAILSHEAFHHRQRDCAWRVLSTLACAFAWPQPLVWIAARRLEAAAEDACDAAVVRGGVGIAAYAKCLLTLAERPPLRGAARTYGAGVVPNRSQVGRRVAAVLSGAAVRLRPAGRRTRAVLALAMLAVAAGAAVLVATRTPRTTYTADSDPKAIAAYERMLAAIGGARSLAYSVEFGVPGTMKTVHEVVYRAPDQARVSEMESDRLVPAVTTYLDGDRLVVESGADGRYREVRRMTSDERPTGAQARYGWARRNSGLLQLRANRAGDEVLILLDALQKSSPQLALPRRVVFDGSGRVAVESMMPAQNGMNWKLRTVYAIGPDAFPRLIRTERSFQGRDSVQESKYFAVRLNGGVSDAALAFRPKKGAVRVADETERDVPTPEAQAILDAMREAYTDLQSLRFDAGGPNASMSVRWARPAKARIEVRYPQYPHQNLTLVADGSRMMIDDAEHPDRVLLTEATPENIAGLGGAGLSFNLNEALIYLDMTTGNGPRIDFRPFRLTGKGEANGALCDIIELREPFSDRADFPIAGTYHLQRLFVGRADHLVRRVVVENKFDAKDPAVRAETLDFRNVSGNGPVDETAFAFTVPKGRRTFASMEALRESTPRVVQEDARPAVGAPAPEIAGPTFDGRSFDLKALRGKTVLVHAWTYGVTNHRQDLPIYEAMQAKYGAKGLVIIGIPCEEPGERDHLAADLKARHIRTPQLWDGKGREGGIQKALNLTGFPWSYLILPDGRVFARDFFGPQIEPTIQAALKR